MFIKKKALAEDLSRELEFARSKRNALTSDVATLNTQIAELETRLVEEEARRERERVEREIEGITKQLEETVAAFAPAIAGLSDAADAAAVFVPEARGLHDFLRAAATEVGASVDLVMREVHRRREAVLAGHAALKAPPLVKGEPEAPKALTEPRLRLHVPGKATPTGNTSAA